MGSPPQVSVALTAEDRGLSAAIQGLNAELKNLTVTQNSVAASAEGAAAAESQLAGSMSEARGAAALLGEETGVKLNRHLRSVLASSETLGPLLEKAFPIVAALGFAEVIAHVAEKISDLIGEYFIYTEAQKKAFEELAKDNQELIKQEGELVKAREEGALKQLSGSKRVGEQIRELQEQARIAAGRGATPGTPEFVSGFSDAEAAKQATIVQKIANLREEQRALEAKEAATVATARANASAAAARNELAIRTSQIEAEQKANELSYARGLETLAQYFDRRTTLIDEQAQKEKGALTADLAAAQAELNAVRAEPPSADRTAKEIAARQRVADVQAKMDEIALRAKEQLAEADAELRTKSEENARIITAYREADLALQGRASAAAQVKLVAEKQAYEQALLATGEAKADADAEVAAWERRRELAAAFSETQKATQATMAEFQERQKAARDIDETQGPFSAAARANVEAMRAEIALVTAELEKMRAEAIPGNEAQQKAIADTTKKLVEMQQTLDQIDIGSRLKDQFSTAVASDVSNFFSKGIAGAHSFGDAMRSLAASIVQSAQQIIGQLIQMQIRAMLFKALTSAAGAAGGGGGLGVTPFESGGGSLPLASLPEGFATGGAVTGPGGPTSDQIPAMLSAGEFVMSAESVKAIGAANLEAINAGMSSAPTAGAPMHFAAGGFTGGELTHTSNINMGIGLDEGLILRHLGSKKAAAVILTQLANNSKAAQRALSRTD